MVMKRFERNIELFGESGQQRLRESRVAVVGVGGLGTHVVQQLALLGVGALTLVDGEELSESNKNRYVGVRHDDPVPGSRKVDLAEVEGLGGLAWTHSLDGPDSRSDAANVTHPRHGVPPRYGPPQAST